jgi:periplasmic protein TonB
MREAVSDILDLRARQAEGLSRMVIVSLVAHGVLITMLVFAPRSWTGSTLKTPPNLMTISLGGAPGPDAGGMTQLSSRPVQSVTPPDAKPRVETPPAAKQPEMIAPDPLAKTKPKESTKLDKPVEKSASRKPTSGEAVKTGDALANTRGQAIPFGGLSTSGGGGTGATLDVKDFCCPEYIVTMVQRIRSNWSAQQGAGGNAIVKFTIRRDGMLTNVELERSSGNEVLDLAARRAVLYTRQLPPLPAQFTEPFLTVHVDFGYYR